MSRDDLQDLVAQVQLVSQSPQFLTVRVERSLQLVNLNIETVVLNQNYRSVP